MPNETFDHYGAASIAAGQKRVDLAGSLPSPARQAGRRAPDLPRVDERDAAGVDRDPAGGAARRATGRSRSRREGELDIDGTVRIASLHADVHGRGLQLEGQPLGDAHLTAESEGQVLRTRLEANIANSAIKGDGSWRLEGDYPGSAIVTFSRLDFAQLRAWIAPSESRRRARSRALPKARCGSKVRHSSPRLCAPSSACRSWRSARRRTPDFPRAITLRNAGPVVASVANSIITVQSARLTGRVTDVSLRGRVLLQSDRSPLDLRVAGKIDLGIVQDFDPDFIASGHGFGRRDGERQAATRR